MEYYLKHTLLLPSEILHFLAFAVALRRVARENGELFACIAIAVATLYYSSRNNDFGKEHDGVHY